MYVCIHVCMYCTCMCVCKHACMHACTRIMYTFLTVGYGCSMYTHIACIICMPAFLCMCICKPLSGYLKSTFILLQMCLRIHGSDYVTLCFTWTSCGASSHLHRSACPTAVELISIKRGCNRNQTFILRHLN